MSVQNHEWYECYFHGFSWLFGFQSVKLLTFHVFAWEFQGQHLRGTTIFQLDFTGFKFLGTVRYGTYGTYCIISITSYHAQAAFWAWHALNMLKLLRHGVSVDSHFILDPFILYPSAKHSDAWCKSENSQQLHPIASNYHPRFLQGHLVSRWRSSCLQMPQPGGLGGMGRRKMIGASLVDIDSSR